MKEFILILGGSGVGKNYFIATNYGNNADIVDVDEIKTTLGSDKAISSLKDILIAKFKQGSSPIIHPSVGKNCTANINKLKLAKLYNYTTTVVFLHGTPEQGIQNIKNRVTNGGHDVPIEKIKSSYELSHQSFLKTLKEGSQYIDKHFEKTMAVESFTFFFNKKALLIENNSMLDISILNIDKAKNKINSLLDIPVVVTEKTDGVKVTIIRNNTKYSTDWKDNWIVAYKGNILHPEDFEGISSKHEQEVRESSIGISQFKIVFDMLKAAHESSKIQEIPQNTELFFEFLIRKPTITRQYKNLHQLILIASSPTTYKEEYGRLITKPNKFDTTVIKDFAKILNVQTPPILFQGKITELISHTKDPKIIIQELKNIFLTKESAFGGLMEGVVLEFSNGEHLKIVQEDQYDKETRQKIKQKYEPKDSNYYYEKIRQLAQKAINSIGAITNMKSSLKELSLWIYSENNNELFKGLDLNKTELNAKDDVFLTAKTMLLRKLPGNNNALFLGRMSPLTIAHYRIIEQALKDYDFVAVNLVKSKSNSENPFKLDTQIKMLKKCFGNEIEITISETGNLVRVLQKPSKIINVVLAGTDRFENYKQQLEHTPDVKVIEVPRVDDVSGTRVRKALIFNNLEDFKANTPQQIWDMFDELKKEISSFN
jgi:nicotinamide mononucleotide adenylyltransferase/predicted ABC-type ATPase